MKTWMCLFLIFQFPLFAQTQNLPGAQNIAQSSVQHTAELPIERLKGLYQYQKNFEVKNIRRAESVPFTTSAGSQRVEELKAEGYSCIRKNQQIKICSLNWKPEKAPEGTDQSVEKFMKGIQIDFEGAENAVELIHDGSTSQEWNVYESVQIMETKIGLYRVVRFHDGRIFISFPVNEDQPMSPLLYKSNAKLGLTLIGNIKDTPQSTTAYTIEAYLEKAR